MAEVVQDSCGDWYLCLLVKTEEKQCTATGEIGIDYGCKTAATCSNGDKLETKFIQQYAENLLSHNVRIRKIGQSGYTAKSRTNVPMRHTSLQVVW